MLTPFDGPIFPSFAPKLLIASPATVQRLRESLPSADRGDVLATIRAVPGLEDGKVYEVDEPGPLTFKPVIDPPPLPEPEFFAPRITYWTKPLRLPMVTVFPSFDWDEPRKRRVGKAEQRRALVREGLKRRRLLRRIPVALRKACGLWPRGAPC